MHSRTYDHSPKNTGPENCRLSESTINGAEAVVPCRKTMIFRLFCAGKNAPAGREGWLLIPPGGGGFCGQWPLSGSPAAGTGFSAWLANAHEALIMCSYTQGVVGVLSLQ